MHGRDSEDRQRTNGEELKLSSKSEQKHYREKSPYNVITPASNGLPRVCLPVHQALEVENVVMAAS